MENGQLLEKCKCGDRSSLFDMLMNVLFCCRAEDAIDKVIEKTPDLGRKNLRPCNTLDSHFIGFEGKIPK